MQTLLNSENHSAVAQFSRVREVALLLWKFLWPHKHLYSLESSSGIILVLPTPFYSALPYCWSEKVLTMELCTSSSNFNSQRIYFHLLLFPLNLLKWNRFSWCQAPEPFEGMKPACFSRRAGCLLWSPLCASPVVTEQNLSAANGF